MRALNKPVKRRKHRETKEREMTLLLRFVRDEKGTTAIEYALIAVGISVAILTSVQLVGSDVSALYDRIAGAVAGF
jgi:pilus assembly protein Flp/PilA